MRLHKPNQDTIERYREWVKNHIISAESELVFGRGFIGDPEATTGLLTTLRRDRLVSKYASEAIKRGSIVIDEKNMVWGSNFLKLNGVEYQTRLVTGILVALDINFGDTPVYQGDKGHELLVLMSKVGEVGLVAPCFPPGYEKEDGEV